MKNITGVIEGILDASTTDDCIVLAQCRSTSNIRFANTTLTTNGIAEQAYIAIYAIHQQKIGSVITAIDDETDVISLLKNAEQAAKLSETAIDYADLIEGDARWPDNKFSTSNEIDQTYIYNRLSDCFEQTRSKGLELFGYSESKVITYFVANSRGLRKQTPHTESIIEMNLKSKDFRKSVWAGAAGHRPDELEVQKLYNELLQKMEWSRKSIALPAGKYETILEPSAVADMLMYNYWSSSRRDADEGKNSFSRPDGKNAIGEQICGENVTIFSDPSYKNFEVPDFEIAYSTSSEQSIFDNGLELNKTDWIKNGKVASLITPRYWAKVKHANPAPYIANIIFEHKGSALEEMIKSTKEGLLITCLWYIREVDPQVLLLTGLTRDGVFLIKDGRVAGAVNNFRFNISPMAMLKQTVEIGTSQKTLAREFGDYFTFALIPPLRVKNFNMSTVSEAI